MKSYLEIVGYQIEEYFNVKFNKTSLYVAVELREKQFIDMYFDTLYLKSNIDMYLYAKKKIIKTFFEIEKQFIKSYYKDNGIKLDTFSKYKNIEYLLKDLENEHINYETSKNNYLNITNILLTTLENKSKQKTNLLASLLEKSIINYDEVSFSLFFKTKINSLNNKLKKFNIKVYKDKIYYLNNSYIVVLVINYRNYPFIYIDKNNSYSYLYLTKRNFKFISKNDNKTINDLSRLLSSNLNLSYISPKSIKEHLLEVKEYDISREELSILNIVNIESLEEDFSHKYDILSKVNLDKKAKSKSK